MDPLEATALLAYYQTAALSNDDPFDIPHARIFTITSDGEVKVMITAGDVYLGLQVLPAAYEKIGNDPVIGVETVGWAAPVGSPTDHCVPADHPQRRRVRLIAVVNRDQEVASALAFRDDNDNVNTNAFSEGSLAAALKDCMDRVLLLQSLQPKSED